MSFTIVEFIRTQEVEVVPTKWLYSGNTCLQCYWPNNYKTARLRKAVILEEEPSESCWSLFDIKLIKSFETYDEARSKLNRAEDTDNLESESANSKEQGSGVRSSFRQLKKAARKRRLAVWSSDDDSDRASPSPVRKEMSLPSIEFPDHLSKVSKLSDNQTPLPGPPTPSPPRPPTLTPARRPADLSVDTSNLCCNTTDFFKKIAQRLETMSAVQEQHSIILQELLNNSRVSLDVGTTDRPDGMPNLPLRSIEDLEDWEAFLHLNKTNYAYACKLLSTVGGGSPQQAARKILKRLMSSELAQHFNWAGRAPKKPFKVLLSASLIVDAVKKLQNGPTAGIEPQVEEAIKEWLKYASVRVFSAQKRKNSC